MFFFLLLAKISKQNHINFITLFHRNFFSYFDQRDYLQTHQVHPIYIRQQPPFLRLREYFIRSRKDVSYNRILTRRVAIDNN